MALTTPTVTGVIEVTGGPGTRVATVAPVAILARAEPADQVDLVLQWLCPYHARWGDSRILRRKRRR